MNDLKVYELFQNENGKNLTTFYGNTNSNLNVNTVFEKVEANFDWLTLMEDSIRYIDNILRNPNRFIVNEDELVKIELARRVTVESIKHLAKHTNYIQKIEDNGDVKPSKILNINKDETFNTYENRFIYTLIDSMSDYVEQMKKMVLSPSSLKNYKKMDFTGTSMVGKEKVNMSFTIESSLNYVSSEDKEIFNGLDDRIQRLCDNISMLKSSSVYLDLKKLHVARVIPPIKKTNVILKNTNFQYAMKLWDFLQSNQASAPVRSKSRKNYEDTGELKKMTDETFLLSYLTLSTLGDVKPKVESKKEKEELTDKLIEKIIELNPDLPETQLRNKIGDKLAVIRNKKQADLSEVINTYTTSINKYLEKINNFKFEEGNIDE